MKAYYSDHYVLPLPAGHRFPMAKYSRLRARAASELPEVRLSGAPPANDAELRRAHDADYVARVVGGKLDAAEVRAIGFPWSAAMVERSRCSAGATIAACRSALVDGVAANLAGGTHHAARARGAGYCVFNDVAIAVRALQSERDEGDRRLAVAIVDLDVHQGDGTAQIFANDPTVFTLSIHGASNFPFRKQASDLDVALPDTTGDAAYLEALDCALAELARRFTPHLLIYVSGADAHENDRLGRLALTRVGMQARDAQVFAFAERLGVPVAVTMAGGYGFDIDTTVDIHLQTLRAAVASWQRRAARCAT
jgi:acetoin utilization deacetylase AcuC-like enzyme